MAVQKVVTITLHLDYPDGVTKAARKLLDLELEKAFTPDLRDSWWGMDAGALPKKLIFESSDHLVQEPNVFAPYGPNNIEAQVFGSAWAKVGGLHEARRQLIDTSINAAWDVSATDTSSGNSYTAEVLAVYRVGILKEFP